MTALGNPLSVAEGPSLCAACAIRHNGICGALSSDEIADLNTLARRKELVAGQTHVLEGDQARDFANITSGVAKLVRLAEDGRSQIVGLLFPSDFIVASLADPAVTVEPNTIAAVTDLELCLFPRTGFESLLEKYPMLEIKILKQVMNELHVARDWMVLLGRKTAEERVASFLLHVAMKMQNSGCSPQAGFELPMGRADIADYIGLTIETVSRKITKLRKDGVITFEGSKRIVVVDHQRLQERAGF